MSGRENPVDLLEESDGELLDAVMNVLGHDAEFERQGGPFSEEIDKSLRGGWGPWSDDKAAVIYVQNVEMGGHPDDFMGYRSICMPECLSPKCHSEFAMVRDTFLVSLLYDEQPGRFCCAGDWLFAVRFMLDHGASLSVGIDDGGYIKYSDIVRDHIDRGLYDEDFHPELLRLLLEREAYALESELMAATPATAQKNGGRL